MRRSSGGAAACIAIAVVLTVGCGGSGTGGRDSAGGSSAGGSSAGGSGGRANGGAGGGGAGITGAAGTGASAGGGGRAGAGASAGGGGRAGAGGSTGIGGGGGGGGATVLPPCPASPPQNGSACTVAQSCFYEDCAAAGRTAATCRSGTWAIETAACGTVSCTGAGIGGLTCPAGNICVVQAGGALLKSCVQDTCASGLVTCGCIQSCVPGGCSLLGSAATGYTIYCSGCPQATCA